MKLQRFLCVFLVLLLTNSKSFAQKTKTDYDFSIAFGSCNDQERENLLWKEVIKNNPDLWIWGGDNVYSDTEDMQKMRQDYQVQKNNKGYQLLTNTTEIIGTWDDHDYGKNDAGKEYRKRVEAQGLFLDFMGVAKDDPRRTRKGVYHSKVYATEQGSIKVILLDTRYFRDPIVKTESGYTSNKTGTILGEEQWTWFQQELNNSTADFNIVVSSIQVLPSEHRFEKWANFPSEIRKFQETISTSKAKNIFLLSGDRHISEFSRLDVKSMNYPLIEFTSSGLTHSYRDFTWEKNSKRIKEVIFQPSFGMLHFDFDNQTITMQMRGKNNVLLQEYIQSYP